MPHAGTLFRDHKKKFILVQTGSAPYYGEDLEVVRTTRSDARDRAFTLQDQSADGFDGFQRDIDLAAASGTPQPVIILYGNINLTETPKVAKADNFRVGMNFVWKNGHFGIHSDFRTIYRAAAIGQFNLGGGGFGNQGQSSAPSYDPSNVYVTTEQYGYGLSILKTQPTTKSAYSKLKIKAKAKKKKKTRATLNDLWDEKNSSLGTPQLTDATSPSITKSRRTRQEFLIAPAPGNDPSSLGPFQDADGVSVPDWWTQPDAWKTHVDDNILGSFEDFAFNMWWPFPFDKINQSYAGAAHIRDIYVDIKPSYNFHIPAYETVISSVTSSLLPNLYVFASEFDEYFTDEMNSRFKQHIEFGNLIPPDRVFDDVLNSKGEKIGEKDYGQYFQIYAKAVENFNSGRVVNPDQAKATLSNLAEKYENIAFPMSNLNLLKDNEGKERLFPMNIKVEFSTDINTKVADALKDANLFSTLITELINNENYKTEGTTWDFKEWSKIPDFYNVRKVRTVGSWDLGKWIDDIIIANYDPFKNIAPEFCDSDVVLLGKGDEEIISATRPEFKLFTKLMVESFKNKLSDIIDDKMRSFKDIVKGEFAYSETLFYSIARLRKEGDKWELEQRIWLPNSRDIDVLKYFDTQVKYNVPYRYYIGAYQLVLGNKYEYDKKELWHTPKDLHAKLCLFNEPSLKLLTIPYYDSLIDYPNGIIIMDKPPVPPNVNVIPYKGKDDRILIWLNGNVGDNWQPDIRIFPDELSERNEMKRNKDGEINFKSDDPVSSFEIFRITKRPQKYSDFKTMGAPFSTDTTSYEDRIQPNKKYYYTFRSIDTHNHTSNPSPVYEVELVKNDENVFALIKIVDMELPPERQINKNAKRFIQIKPSLIQTILDETKLEEASLKPDAQIPNMSEFARFKSTPSIWGTGVDNQKKYKIRLNSKQSGKKLDINLKFKLVATGSI